MRISDWSSDVCSSDLPLTDARASAVQFRYLWVTDAEGVKLFDITHMDRPVPVPAGTVRIADARKLYLARTYMYVAAKADGLDRTRDLWGKRVSVGVVLGGRRLLKKKQK